MHKHPRDTHHGIDMNYLVPGLALFTTREFGVVTLASRFFDFLIAWTERMARRSTRI